MLQELSPREHPEKERRNAVDDVTRDDIITRKVQVIIVENMFWKLTLYIHFSCKFVLYIYFEFGFEHIWKYQTSSEYIFAVWHLPTQFSFIILIIVYVCVCAYVCYL